MTEVQRDSSFFPAVDTENDWTLALLSIEDGDHLIFWYRNLPPTAISEPDWACREPTLRNASDRTELVVTDHFKGGGGKMCMHGSLARHNFYDPSAWQNCLGPLMWKRHWAHLSGEVSLSIYKTWIPYGTGRTQLTLSHYISICYLLASH